MSRMFHSVVTVPILDSSCGQHLKQSVFFTILDRKETYSIRFSFHVLSILS